MRLSQVNRFDDLHNLCTESVDLDTKIIGVFPGAFKPPHKGHFKTAEVACRDCDEVYIFMSSASRELEKATTGASRPEWEKYSGLLKGGKQCDVCDRLNIELAEVDRMTSASELRATILSSILASLDSVTFYKNVDAFLPDIDEREKKKVTQLLLKSAADHIITKDEAEPIWEIYVEELRRRFPGPDTNIIFKVVKGSPVGETYNLAEELNNRAAASDTRYTLKLYTGE